MRLVVEEAQDHSACMEKLRSLYGADCVVVHSFRIDDRYRVVIALETDIRTPASCQGSAVKNVVSHPYIRWDTLIDGAESVNTPLPTSVVSAAHMETKALQHGPNEISSGLIELAARIKALDALEPLSALEPESQDFRQAVFSEVLAEATAASDKPHNIQQHGSDQVAPSIPEIFSTLTDAPAAKFPAPVDALIKTHESLIADTLNTNTPLEETPIPRVCTSDSAENFANLLLSCVADSQKSLPLYEQTRLRMVAS